MGARDRVEARQQRARCAAKHDIAGSE